MSRYDFICTKCGAIQEREIPMAIYDKEKDKQYCGACHGKMDRVYNTVYSTQYKCKGFYDTDSRGVSGR